MTNWMVATIVVLTQSVFAAVALAECREERDVSCVEGTVWDSQTHNCAPKPGA